MHGRLEIRATAVNGETRVNHSYARAPFHFLPASQREGAPILTVVNSSGGVLGGDRLEMDVGLGPGCVLELRTQAATKIYRSKYGSANSVNRFRLGEGARLDYFPDEIIPFAGSNYEQTTQVELRPNAVMVIGEIVAAGRLARGERFAFERLALDLDCRIAGVSALRDRADLRPSSLSLHTRPILGEAPVWGSFYLLTTDPVAPPVVESIDEALDSVDGGTGGATAGPTGIFGRVVGSSVHSVRQALQTARGLAWNSHRIP